MSQELIVGNVVENFDSLEEMCLTGLYEAATSGGTVGEYIDQYYEEGRFPVNHQDFLEYSERREE
jgi:hypothetical protein